MRHRILINFLVVFSLPFLNACGVVDSLKGDKRCTFQVPDYRHMRSCGPQALEVALKSLGYNLTAGEISESIQQTGNGRRRLLAIFDSRARGITFPDEMISFCNKNGIKVKLLDSLEDLNVPDKGLILIRKRGTLSFHWMAYPNNSNIRNFFGRKTSIYKVYLLYK